MKSTDPLRDHLERSLSDTYQVERELGGGGMARVYLAEDRLLNRKVVLKVLPPETAHALSAERFAREVRFSARLQHPNIVPVLSAGVAGDVPYYTMPFVEGESLRTRLDALSAVKERLQPGRAIEILRDVARALAYAHSHGVVHRDIKPENVLLAFDAAVVADFGIAKAAAAARQPGLTASGALTLDGVALGTPAYMSPEQATGDPNVDHRADVYAWGMLAYELLSGAHPFAGRHSPQSLILAHLTEMPRPLAEVAPSTPPAINDLVMRSLAKKPQNRPSSALELLEAIPGNTATPGRSVTPGTPAIASSWRKLLLRAGPIAVGVAIVAVVPLYFVRGGSPSPTASPAPTTQSVRQASASPGYDAYVRGKVRSSRENVEDLDAAAILLRQAITNDPAFAPAYAELARVHYIKSFYFAPDSQKKALRDEADVQLEKAFALDANLAQAHFVRGLLLWTPARRFPHEQSVQSYKRALELDSTLDEPHHQLGLVYMHVGLFDQASAELTRALAINPGNTLARFRVGVVDLYRGDFERAYRIFNSSPLDRNASLWAFQTATALYRLGRESEARDLLDRYLKDYPADEGGVGNSVRAMMLARAGRRREAEASIATALKLGRSFGHFHHTAYNIASAYALLGDNDNAIRYLQEAADDGFPCYPLFASDAFLDGVRKDARFVAMMEGLKRDWEERRRTF